MPRLRESELMAVYQPHRGYAVERHVFRVRKQATPSPVGAWHRFSVSCTASELNALLRTMPSFGDGEVEIDPEVA